ncbi:MAG: response regulator transcription factor [Verrucomicrobia bacterium]|nr:response regulator transcription factor [Verrucomicrobiota bacterium]
MSVISHHTSDDKSNGNNGASKYALSRTSESHSKNTAARASKGQCLFLVVDRPMTREGLALMLEQANFRIVGQAGNGKETLAHPMLALTEVVVVDLLSGGEDAISLIKALSSRHLRSVVCSIRENSTWISAALAAGAGGYVTANDEPQHLVEAIHAVVAGCNYVSPRAGAGLAKKVAGLEDPSPKEDLSRQQLQIYQLLGKGDSPNEISGHLKISPRTVESYCTRMIYKLDLPGMKALRRHAISSIHSALL